jgi:hypothetical protein
VDRPLALGALHSGEEQAEGRDQFDRFFEEE